MVKNLTHKSILLSLFSTLLVFNSCSKPKAVKLTADLSALNASEVVIHNGIYSINDTIKLVNGKLDYSLPIESEQVLTMTAGNTEAQIYVIPFSKLDFSFNSKRNEFAFTGETAIDNIAIGIFNNLMKQVNGEYPLIEIAAGGEHEYVEILNKKYNKVKEFIELQRSNISPVLFERLVGRINSASATDMLKFPTFYEYATQSKVTLTQGFQEQTSQIKLEDPSMLDFPEGVAMGRAMVEQEVDFNEIGSVVKYYIALVEQVDPTFSDPQIREFFKFQYLKDKIAFAGGLDGIGTHLEKFYESASNQDFVNALKKEASQWQHLQRGMDAPDFTGVTREGSVVKLSELKGKNVYVDVWATWCEPCIREIPSLNEVEHDYLDKDLTIIRISIDKITDKKKWENFIKENELGGTQLFANGDWNSDIVRNYNINGIPRFLLIDASGKIVMADAPRPSSPDLRDVLSEMGI